MACMTTYLKDKLIKHVFLNTSYTSPSTVYIAAFTTQPTVGGGGTEAVGYTRISISTGMVFSGTGTGGVENNTTKSFTDLPNGTYVGIATFDALTSGNMLTFGALGAPKTTTDGTMSFPAGDLTVVFA